MASPHAKASVFAMTLFHEVFFGLRIILSCYAYISILTYIYILFRRRKNVEINSEGKNIVFITAHPDDECMFFSPTIIAKSKQASCLCFTTGNYDKKGDIRRKEIISSCSTLGIPKERVSVLDISAAQDDPAMQWNLDVVSNEIEKYCEKYDITEIYTFDDYGVSGHNNHKELYHAVRNLKRRNTLSGVQCYSLESVGLYRKYVSILDLPISLFSSSTIFVSSPADVLRAQRAMYAHWSQFVWFRVLFILFSRYLIINTCTQIT